MAEKTPSKFQQAITGTWHGLPSVFEVDGTHVGFNKVDRESKFEDGVTTYYMRTHFQNVGPLRYRFDMGSEQMAFGVIDSDQNRVYCGPDFMGSGRPYGMLVDSNYYSPGWNTDLRTLNLVLPERQIQVYSSELYEGPVMAAVFNGIYIVTQDHETNPATQQRVDDFIESERRNAKKPFTLPVKVSGQWTGVLETYNGDQELLGTTDVQITYTPLTLLSARMDVTMSGVINRQFSYQRSHNGAVHKFEGPDVWGNGRSYGRYLFSTQHFYGEPQKIRARDTIIDDNYALCAVWQFFEGNKETFTCFGVMDWAPGDTVLEARYAG
ncbi:MAG: hypothetical protein K0U72_12730 [Gammaproteobacteria bacterium]|nr:hypothetical protein [Gammaproteobacteria bacterium]